MTLDSVAASARVDGKVRYPESNVRGVEASVQTLSQRPSSQYQLQALIGPLQCLATVVQGA
jgi:hypothetical protein